MEEGRRRPHLSMQEAIRPLMHIRRRPRPPTAAVPTAAEAVEKMRGRQPTVGPARPRKLTLTRYVAPYVVEDVKLLLSLETHRYLPCGLISLSPSIC